MTIIGRGFIAELHVLIFKGRLDTWSRRRRFSRQGLRLVDIGQRTVALRGKLIGGYDIVGER